MDFIFIDTIIASKTKKLNTHWRKLRFIGTITRWHKHHPQFKSTQLFGKYDSTKVNNFIIFYAKQKIGKCKYPFCLLDSQPRNIFSAFEPLARFLFTPLFVYPNPNSKTNQRERLFWRKERRYGLKICTISYTFKFECYWGNIYGEWVQWY